MNKQHYIKFTDNHISDIVKSFNNKVTLALVK